MASDCLVTSQHVLKAMMELQRRESQTVLSELELLEPDLTEFILESLTALHHTLAGSALTHAKARKFYRSAERIVLVSVMSLRSAHQDLWKDEPEPPAEGRSFSFPLDPQ